MLLFFFDRAHNWSVRYLKAPILIEIPVTSGTKVEYHENDGTVCDVTFLNLYQIVFRFLKIFLSPISYSIFNSFSNF